MGAARAGQAGLCAAPGSDTMAANEREP